VRTSLLFVPVFLVLVTSQAHADALLIRNARVHTADVAGTIDGGSVLVDGGVIRAVGRDLVAPAGARVVDAGGRPLTPGLFAGINQIGIEEISLEPATVDSAYAPGAAVPSPGIEMRPEFDVTLAFNPDSLLVPVTRVEGYTFTMLSPLAQPGGTLIAGQGGIETLDGVYREVPATGRTLFVAMGSGAAPLTGNSRAAQLMLLEQAVREAAGRIGDTDARLLTAAGRETLARYLGGGRVVFAADRAVDIRRALAFAARVGMKPVIAGGAEAWKVADVLKAANAAVILDPLQNLPGSFDQLYSTLENAARLDAAGVGVIFASSDMGSHNARKLRQGAGNAVAHGLPWEAGLAALTATPASVFGASDRGRIAAGLRADLVLWNGDPLEVSSYAEQVFIEGREQSPRTRQTELRDRHRLP
jgi:imidazolonepropionase-like amidohydrolase